MIADRRAKGWSAAAVGAAFLIGTVGVASPIGLEIDSPVEPSTAYSVSETTSVSPLTPGVASEVKYTIDRVAPLAPSDTGFARLIDDGDNFILDDIDLSGLVATSTIEVNGSINIDYILDRVTDEYVLFRSTEFGLGIYTSSLTVRLDRATGEAVTPLIAYPGLSERPQMSDDGTFVATHLTDDRPIVMVIEGSALMSLVEWDEDEFDVEDPQPHLHPARPTAAVVGIPAGGNEGEAWVRSLAGGEDRRWELPCPAVSCSFDLMAFTAGGTEGTLFYSVEASGPDFDASTSYRQVDVATGVVSDAPPVVLGSPNGRYGVGPAPGVGDELSATKLNVHDFATGRVRTVAVDAGTGYTVVPVSLSDDGTSVRYTAAIRCIGVCIAQPSFFGRFDLLPVADVTRGPAEDEILRLYRAVFGRIPDPGGFEFWINQYREGEPLLDIARGFAASDEFVDRFGAEPTDEALIDLLYRNVLDRAGDAGGVDFWLARRADGASIAELLVAFANSPENIERTGTREPISAPVGRVLRIYQAMLGRQPDAEGLGFWVGRYNNGLSLAEMAGQFTFQPEFTAIYGAEPTNAELVDGVYRNVLGRPGDEGGVAFWLDQLETGLTVPELFVSFADSPENIENTGTVR